MDGALGAVDTHGVEVVGHLVCLHRVFFVTTVAVWVHPGNAMSLHNLEQALPTGGREPARDAIWGHDVNPDDLVSYLDAATLDGWSQRVHRKVSSS